MSMNLGLKALVKGKMETIDLAQTPTEKTYEFLNAGNSDSILESYLKWFKERHCAIDDLNPKNPYEAKEIEEITDYYEETAKYLRSLENKQFMML